MIRYTPSDDVVRKKNQQYLSLASSNWALRCVPFEWLPQYHLNSNLREKDFKLEKFHTVRCGSTASGPFSAACDSWVTRPSVLKPAPAF